MTQEQVRRAPADAFAHRAHRPSRPRPVGDDLRASELRYRRLFESAPDGIVLLDADTGRITDVNPSVEEMLGFAHEELVGRRLWDIGPPDAAASVREAVRRIQDDEYLRCDDLALETKDHAPLAIELVGSVYVMDGERVIQCNVRDIRERRRAAADLQARNDALTALVAETRRRDRESSRLNQMNDLLHACATQEEAYGVIALVAGELFSGHAGVLAAFDPRDQSLVPVARWGARVEPGSGFPATDCWAMRRGQPHEISAPLQGPVCGHFAETPSRGHLCVPLIVGGEALGLLSVVTSAPGAQTPPVSPPLAVALGEAVKMALANLKLRKSLREQATLDELTGLFNRRHLDESLARELHRAQRRGAPLCLAMLDLDHFKRINDQFGHEAGDAVLRALGRVLRDEIRRSDITCRYGGEEFVVVFPDSLLADARRRVEQIRAVVRRVEFRHGDRALGPITLSAGVAQASPDGCAPGELLRAADDALYAAKRAGRDCVVAHAPEPKPAPEFPAEEIPR